MEILNELEQRGIIKDYSSKELVARLLKEQTTIYCGFDPSFHSLHMGNYLLITLLKRLSLAKQRIVVLCGGATGMIGDPSGKSKERNLLDKKTLNQNITAIKKQLSTFINIDDQQAILVNNYDWIGKLSFIDFLRDYGKHFSINYLLAKDVVKSRLETGISYSEFSYSLIQAVDFLHLYQKHGVTIQIGGSDQWGNMTAGLELIRKVYDDQTKCAVFTANLITDSNGKKFGKSEAGALYLDPKLTNPYTLYQYFLNVGDQDTIKFLKLFTFLSLKEIDRIEQEHLANLGQRIAQKELGKQIVCDIHGEEAYLHAMKLTSILFTGTIDEIQETDLRILFANNTRKIQTPANIFELLINSQVLKSNREVRELVNAKSIRINGQLITNPDSSLVSPLFKQYYLIKKGKKDNFLVQIND